MSFLSFRLISQLPIQHKNLLCSFWSNRHVVTNYEINNLITPAIPVRNRLYKSADHFLRDKLKYIMYILELERRWRLFVASVFVKYNSQNPLRKVSFIWDHPKVLVIRESVSSKINRISNSKNCRGSKNSESSALSGQNCASQNATVVLRCT